MRAGFELTKWYLDGVTAGGGAVVLYWAELCWHRLSLHYASTLRLENGRLDERWTLNPGPPPSCGADTVAWDCSALDLRGGWRGPLAAEGRHTLLSRDERHLSWHCLQPFAQAELSLGGQRLSATGYTERLSLTLPPWELPIAELRWGRAHAGGHSVVWIDWTGEPSYQLVLVDGRVRAGGAATAGQVTASGLRLTLGARAVLREGPILGTSLGRVPGLAPLLSSVGLHIDEHKWLSPVTLRLDGAEMNGTALHEVVRWL